MSNRRISMAVGAALLVACAGGVVGCSNDPCLSIEGGASHRQLRPDNYSFFACNGGIYITDGEPSSYRRADVDVDSFQALPYKFGRDKQHFFYVASGSEMWGHNELRVLSRIDIATAEVVTQNVVRDRAHIYRVLDNQIFIEDHFGRLVGEER